MLLFGSFCPTFLEMTHTISICEHCVNQPCKAAVDETEHSFPQPALPAPHPIIGGATMHH